MPCAIVGTHPLGLRCIASPGGATRRACRGVRAIFGTRRYPVMSAADFKRSSNNGNAQLASVYDGFRKCMLSLTAGAVVLTSSPTMLVAPEDAIAQAGQVGAFDASGLIFKDKVVIDHIRDRQVAGVSVYLADFQRSITSRLKKDFFEEPTMASISCARTGPIEIKGDLGGPEGQEIFNESKKLGSFKSIRVRRVYDEENGALIYVAYSTRLDTHDDNSDSPSQGRYSTTMCAIPVYEPAYEGV